MQVRPARDQELSALQDIERAAGRQFRDIGMPEIADDDPPAIDELLRYQKAGHAWVSAGPDDVPAAYLIADVVDGNLHIEQISVHPRFARRRIGRLLLDHLARHARAVEAPALTLTTFTDVPWNAPYYLRCGFHVVDEAALTPGIRSIRQQEAARGLDRWPRVCMRKSV